MTLAPSARVPDTVTSRFSVSDPVEFESVRLPNVIAEEPEIVCAPVPLNSTVEVVPRTVPLLTKLPPILSVPAPVSRSVPPLLMVKLPVTVRAPSLIVRSPPVRTVRLFTVHGVPGGQTPDVTDGWFVLTCWMNTLSVGAGRARARGGTREDAARRVPVRRRGEQAVAAAGPVAVGARLADGEVTERGRRRSRRRSGRWST